MFVLRKVYDKDMTIFSASSRQPQQRQQANRLHGACWEWCLLFQRLLPFLRLRIAGQTEGRDWSFLHWHSCAANQWLVWTRYSFSVLDQLYWRSRVFLDFLCMDGDRVSNATMCPTTQCTTCWCPKAQLSDPDTVFPSWGSSGEGRWRTQEAAPYYRGVHRDGTPRDRCKAEV